jgi:hypothetical protein
MAGSIAAVFLYVIGMGHLREPFSSAVEDHYGAPAREMFPILLILPALAIFLLPNMLAAQYAARFSVACPSCNQDLTSKIKYALSTRCCPFCRNRVVFGGRTHAHETYLRHQAIRSRSFLKYWLWAWPILGAATISLHLLDLSAFRQCPNALWAAPLIGTATAGWAWLRTWDHRYLPTSILSAVLLGAGVFLFWSMP